MQSYSKFFKNYGIIFVTIALFLVLALTTDGFLSVRNMRNILDQQSTVLIAACFMTMTIIAGNFDVSSAAVYVAAPLVALVVENTTGSIPLALLAGLFTGVAMGIFNGFVVTRLGVNSFIATLASSFMFFGVGYLVSNRSILRPETAEWRFIARTRVFELTTSTWFAIIVVLFAIILLHRTRFGRNVYACGANREAARLAGVNVNRIQMQTFVMLAVASAFAGILTASRTISAQPSDDFSFVFAVLTAVIVGGTSIAGGQGAIWRTVAAVFFLAFLTNGFNLHQIDPIWQRLIEGFVILLAVSIDSWTQKR